MLAERGEFLTDLLEFYQCLIRIVHGLRSCSEYQYSQQQPRRTSVRVSATTRSRNRRQVSPGFVDGEHILAAYGCRQQPAIDDAVAQRLA
jgi:hypothetical protein